MRRALLVALCATFIVVLGAGQVLGAVYEITSNFGVRVAEQGPCERVGTIHIAPLTGSGNIFSNTLGQILTAELLGGATISRSFGATYTWGGGLIDTFDPTDPLDPDPGTGNYSVIAIEGNDFFDVIINTDSNTENDVVVFGHDAASALCYNLVGTAYSNPPYLALVRNAYRDNLSSTFSGDIYVATVKPKSVTVDLCSESLPTDVLGQVEYCGFGSGTNCIFTFTDTAVGALTGDYTFTLGKIDGAKAGVGFESVVVQKWDDTTETWSNHLTFIVERRDRNGRTITLADFDSNEGLWVASSEIVVDTTLTGPGLYRLVANYGFDSCVASAGIWTIDIFANRVTCGGSFSEIDWDAVEFFMPPADSDNDNLPDDLENAGCTDPNDADTDDDGIPDGTEDANQNGTVDAGETSPCNPDTDSDDIQDGTEIGLTLADIGPDTNAGIFVPDADPNTTTNPLDNDSDNDGRLDGEEDLNHNGAVDGNETDPNESNRSTAMPWIPLLLLEAY